MSRGKEQARQGTATHHPLLSLVERPEGPLKMKRILVVEDDLTLAHLEADILVASGFAVVITDSGEKALQAFRLATPDLVVLDLELSDQLSGWQVLETLRQTTHVPVLITSSVEIDKGKYRSFLRENRSTLDYLPKPYPIQTFLKRVKRMLAILS